MPSGGTAAGRGFLIPSLDGLRFVAILFVVWGHAELPFQFIKESTGVTIFFFLSGYLITTLLRREHEEAGRISIKDFYLRRFFRIVPPLYIVVTAMVTLSLIGIIQNSMTAWGALSTYGFWANYYIILEGRDGLPGGLTALWSLAVEEHYYLMFPIVYGAMRKWLPNAMSQAALLAALCGVIMIWRIHLYATGASFDRIYLATDTRADSILWGAVLAIVANPILGDVRMPKHPWIFSPMLLVSAALFWSINRLPDAVGMTVGYSIQSIALAGIFIPLIMVPSSLSGRAMNWRPIVWLGVVSYSVYLIHRPALILAEEHLSLPHILQATVAIVATVVLSWAMLIWIERPFGRIRRRLSHARESPNTAP